MRPGRRGFKESRVLPGLRATYPSNTVLSGGYVLNSNGNTSLTLRAVRSYAVSDAAWLVRAINGGTLENWELTVVAVCEQ